MYDWTRYWISKGGEPKIQDGFLVDPEDQFRFLNHGLQREGALVRLDEINESCAVLLGEPGIGKTTEVESLTREISEENPSEHSVLHVELGMITGYPALQGELLDAPEIEAWKRGEINLTLVLDALDECGMARIGKHLSKKLFTDLYPAERLTLRITCRSSDWPESLNESLCRFWGLHDLPTYHLAPLRRKDVIQATGANGLDGDAFLNAVQEADASPFAASPLTLDALLSRFKEEGDIPASKADLFEEYCLRLSTEENKDRKETGETGILEPSQRVDLLSRVAALMVFGQRTRLCLDPSTSRIADALDTPGSVLFADEVRSDEKNRSGSRPSPNTDEIRDAVRHSGLLRGSGEGRTFRWRHRSYAEYLAAHFISKQGLLADQVRPLIEHEYDQTIAPPYQNVAVWLATLDREMMEYLLEKDPSLVYAGDPHQYEVEKREALINAILEGIDQGQLYTRLNDRLDDLTRVAHPDLEEQLRHWMVDEEKSDEAREYAIQLARKQELDGLVKDAIDVALDACSDKYVRISAIRLVDELGETEDREQLRPLAVQPGDEDEDRRVAYEARERLLPDLLRFSEFLNQIRADAEWVDPKNVEGNWYHTLDQWSRLLVRQLEDDALMEALQWALSEKEEEYFSDLKRTIVQRAAYRVDVDEIQSMLAEFIADKMIEDRTLPQLDFSDLDRLREQDPNAHQALAREVARRLAEKGWDEEELQVVINGIGGRSKVWTREDIEWLLDDLQEAEKETIERVYATIIRSFFYRNGFPDPEGFSRIHRVSQSSPILREAIAQWVEPIELNSEEADALREREEMVQGRGPDPMDPSFRTQLSEALDLCEDDIAKGWKNLCHLLARTSIEHEATRYNFGKDVAEMPAWRELTSQEREEVTKTGLKFLRSVKVERSDWLPEDTGEWKIKVEVIFGFIALYLLDIMYDGDHSALEKEVWEEWHPAAVLVTPTARGVQEEVRVRIASSAYRHARVECESVARTILTRVELEKDRLKEMIDPIASSERIRDLLLDLQKNSRLSDKNRRILTPYLLRRGITEARSVARELAHLRKDDEFFGGRKMDWFVDVIEADPSFGWSLVRESFAENNEFAEALLDSLVRIDLSALPSSIIGEISKRTYHLFPPEEDSPTIFEVHAVSTREHIGQWRRNLVRTLVRRGTEEAVDVLQNIASQFPDARRWGRTLHRAKKTLRQKSTPAVTPCSFLALADDASRRMLRSNVELQCVVLEALSDLQEQLDAQEQPAATDLWNEITYGSQRDMVRDWLQSKGRFEDLGEEVKEIKGTVYTPKDEERLTDYVARQLRQDLQGRGVTLTRESEVRVQNRTDILVKVPPKEDDNDPLSVIIEVKGAWNKEVLTNIQSQLADRYLDPEDTEYGTCRGIYLVVWFDLDRWSLESSRRDRASRHESPQMLHEKLEEKVEELEGDATEPEPRITPFILCG